MSKAREILKDLGIECHQSSKGSDIYFASDIESLFDKALTLYICNFKGHDLTFSQEQTVDHNEVGFLIGRRGIK